MSVPLLDGYALPKHLVAFRIIEISAMNIALFLQISIGCVAYYKFHRDSKLHRGFKIQRMFFISILLACASTVGGILENAIYWMERDSQSGLSYQISYCTQWMANTCFFLSLLFTLVLRLHITFGGSTFKMSQKTQVTFGIIFILLIISAISMDVAWALAFNDYGQIALPLGGLAFVLFVLLYTLGSFFAVMFFVNNLSKLAKKQSSGSQRNGNDEAETLLNLAAKYVSLYCIAISSSILAVVLMISLSWEMGGLFFSFDGVVNCLCLVMQFAFANKLYLRWCSCPDTCCRALIAKRTKRDIPIESLSPSHSMVLSVSASTSPGTLTPTSSADGVASFSMSSSVTQR